MTQFQIEQPLINPLQSKKQSHLSVRAIYTGIEKTS